VVIAAGGAAGMISSSFVFNVYVGITYFVSERKTAVRFTDRMNVRKWRMAFGRLVWEETQAVGGESDLQGERMIFEGARGGQYGAVL
jgi:hypothetical protein